MIERKRPIGSPLDKYARNVTSQFGEDGIIARLVEILKPPPYFVEFGAWDGVTFSNTRTLAHELGWRGVMIESDVRRFQELQANCRELIGIRCLCTLVGFGAGETLDAILNSIGVHEPIGVLSIDVDGNDYHIWNAIKREPEIVVIEFNPTVPNDVVFVQAADHAVQHGASLLALTRLGRAKGYELAACTMVNAIFVRRERLKDIGDFDNSVGALYQPTQDGRIFQGYDGSIHVVGMPDLWSRNKEEQTCA